MKERSIILPQESVINFYTGSNEIARRLALVKIDDEYKEIRRLLSASDSEKTKYKWLDEGIESQLKQHSSGRKEWLDGKLRIIIIFSFLDNSNEVDHLLREPDGWLEINDDDVISVNPTDTITSTNLFTFSQLVSALRSSLSITDIGAYRYAWIGHGVPCKVLISDVSLNGWHNGRIYLKIEFKPNLQSSKTDETLDSIRNSIETN